MRFGKESFINLQPNRYKEKFVMGKNTLSRDAYTRVRSSATRGGTTNATRGAEEKIKKGLGLDPMVDPKGPAHLGPIRRSLPRFEKQGDFWLLTNGLPMAEETLLDTTGSMGDNVDLAFTALPKEYEMLTSDKYPILKRYDPQIATAIFNDVQDGNEVAVLARSQFEMAEKIAVQMTLLPPGKNGCGNHKEDSQFGLFGAAYLTTAAINRWGLKYYHFTVSDELTVPYIDPGWLKKIFGDDVFDRIKENGHAFDAKNMPDTAQTVADLQTRAHAFFLQVMGHRDQRQATRLWTDMYGSDHVVMLPGGTKYLHCVKAVIIGLTESVLDLQTAADFLFEHGVEKYDVNGIVRALAHIPIGAQTLCPNFDRIPMAGDLFKEKTDLWPIDQKEAESMLNINDSGASDDNPNWL